MSDLFSATDNDVMAADLFRVFGSPDDLKNGDRLLYKALLTDEKDKEERLTNQGEIWCRALMRARIVATFSEALVWLQEKSPEIQIDPLVYDAPVWSIDLTGRHPRANSGMRRLRSFVEGDERIHSSLYDQRLGIATHHFVGKAEMGHFSSTRGQMELFENQPHAFCGPELYSAPMLRRSCGLEPFIPAGIVVGPGTCDKNYIQDLDAMRKEALEAVRSRKLWHEQYAAGRPFLLPLAGMLAAIEYSLIVCLLNHHRSLLNDHLTLLMLINWARIVSRSQKRQGSPPIYMTEVPIVCVRKDGIPINVGRLDCVEVAHINGRKPTKAQSEVLRRINRMYRHGSRPKGFSIATLCLAFVTTFGKRTNLTLKFRDWKTIGDSPDRRRCGTAFSVRDVADKPFARHTRQIVRYDCALPNDKGMRAVSDYAGSDDAVTFQNGILDYRCHDGEKRHVVAVSPEERSQRYARMLEHAQGSAGLRAQVRTYINKMANRIYRTVERTGSFPQLDI